MRKFVASLLLCYYVTLSLVYAGPVEDKQNEIAELEKKVSALQSQSKTLSEQIATYDWQIQLAQLKISQSEDQIASVSARISTLEEKLRDRSKLLEQQIVQAYKQGASDYLQILFGPNKVSQLIAKFKYDQIVQTQNRKFLYETQMVQTSYSEQKTLIEEAKKKLLASKIALDEYIIDRNNLLIRTKNNEAVYQQQVELARQELEALSTSRFTGEKRTVKRGDIVGIMGSTGFSTGPHLHFGYYNIKESEIGALFTNADWYFSRYDAPANALQAKSVYFEYLSCDDVRQTSGVTKNYGNGSLSWPMNNPRITQCFGHTPYSYVYSGNFHHGLDIVDTNNTTVRAIDDGIAYFYKGNSFGNNVRIFHPNGKMSLYLHLR